MEIQFAKTALLTGTSSLKPGLVGSEGKPFIVFWVLAHYLLEVAEGTSHCLRIREL